MGEGAIPVQGSSIEKSGTGQAYSIGVDFGQN